MFDLVVREIYEKYVTQKPTCIAWVETTDVLAILIDTEVVNRDEGLSDTILRMQCDQLIETGEIVPDNEEIHEFLNRTW